MGAKDVNERPGMGVQGFRWVCRSRDGCKEL